MNTPLPPGHDAKIPHITYALALATAFTRQQLLTLSLVSEALISSFVYYFRLGRILGSFMRTCWEQLITEVLSPKRKSNATNDTPSVSHFRFLLHLYNEKPRQHTSKPVKIIILKDKNPFRQALQREIQRY